MTHLAGGRETFRGQITVMTGIPPFPTLIPTPRGAQREARWEVEEATQGKMFTLTAWVCEHARMSDSLGKNALVITAFTDLLVCSRDVANIAKRGTLVCWGYVEKNDSALMSAADRCSEKEKQLFEGIPHMSKLRFMSWPCLVFIQSILWL